MRAPPLVRYMKHLIPRREHAAVAAKAGISERTMHTWFSKGTDPRLSLFEAVLNTMGYRLVIVPMKKEEKQCLKNLSPLP